MIEPMPVGMGFRPFSAFMLVALGLIMILTSSVPADEEGVIWRYVSGSFFVGIFVEIFGLYLVVTSII